MASSNLPNIEILHSIALYCKQYGTVAESLKIQALIETLKQTDVSEKLPSLEKTCPSLSKEERDAILALIEYNSKSPKLKSETVDKILNDIDKYIRSTWIDQTFISAKKIVPILLTLVAIFFVGQKIFYPAKWRATYFNNRSLVGPAYGTYSETEPSNNWGLEAPKSGMSPNNFSVRYEADLRLNKDDTISFKIIADDGVRLFIDNESLIDFWIPQDSIPREASIKLSSGLHKVRLEYFEAEAGAKLEFEATNSNGTPVKFKFPETPTFTEIE